LKDYIDLKKFIPASLDGRILSIIVFSLFFSWLLAFPFEGQVLYAISARHNITPHAMLFGSIAAHFLGLISSGFVVKSLKAAKRLMLASIIVCIVGTSVFFLVPSVIWSISLWTMSFLTGGCVAAWGFCLKSYTPTNQRINTIADGLIWSNILMILLNTVAIRLSALGGLGLSIVFLAGAFFFAARLPENELAEERSDSSGDPKPISPLKPLVFLCLFIIVITINSGLMYQVVNPVFAHHEWLVSWYWAVPYIVALYIMKNLPATTSRSYILFVGIAMMGFAFIAFMSLDRSAASYLFIDTLMLGACGVYDLFWWSILGEMLDFGRNPARILGLGLSANVLGVLMGGVLGNAITSIDPNTQKSSIIALTVVFITLIILPLLHKQLSMLLDNHAYLTMFSEKSPEKSIAAVKTNPLLDQLTEREREIVELLLRGRTYKMIAGELFLSENTVKTHIKNIYSKFNIQSKAQLFALLGNQVLR
jgi:DNA-binding CsgD family transcriptional regulator